MLRAIALAARLNFTIEPTLLAAIRSNRHEIAKASLPRMLEEYYKILRAGASEKAFRVLAEVGLLEPISSELHRGANDPLWRSLAAVDAYRRQFESTPETLTNAILLGSLLVPLGISLHPSTGDGGQTGVRPRPVPDLSPNGSQTRSKPRRPPIPRLGELPLARRDVERLRLIMSLQRRLKDLTASARAQRALAHRHAFREALTWHEIHGGTPDLVEHWKALLAETPAPETLTVDTVANFEPARPEGRRRRRRRRGRRRPPQ